MDKAIAMDTASGRPSGIATIISTTAIIPIYKMDKRVSLENNVFSVNRVQIKVKSKWENTLRIVAAIAYLPIYWAVLSSFFSRSVCYSAMIKSSGFLLLARTVCSPTQQTNAFPCPFITFESVNKNGSGLILWLSSIVTRPF